MNDRITGEQITELNNAQKEFLLNIWQPKDGDLLTDGQLNYVLYKEKLLPLGEGNEQDYSIDARKNYFPLLTIGQLYEVIEKEYGEEAIRYGVSEPWSAATWIDYPLNEESINHLWKAFIRYSNGSIQFQDLAKKLSSMLIETFTLYCKKGEEDKLSEEDFVDSELEKKYGEKYSEIFQQLEEIDIYFNPDELWEYSWDIFNESLE